ncbi:MAG TPA: hypothetical protein VKF37_01895 [Chloroflexota bacterium]|nr:hypothetical protein [Chloroflexota bacterium]
MAAIYADPDIPASGPFANRQRLKECLGALEACGRERLAPLARHMADRCLVRARGDVGVPLRHLDVHTLREALSRLLSQNDDDGYLIFRLVLEGAEPALVAAERGVSRPVLVEQLRDAVDELAVAYEDVANESLGESTWELALAHKPMPRDKGDAPARATARSAGASAGSGRM